jgi:protein-disulfide isomerase
VLVSVAKHTLNAGVTAATLLYVVSNFMSKKLVCMVVLATVGCHSASTPKSPASSDSSSVDEQRIVRLEKQIARLTSMMESPQGGAGDQGSSPMDARRLARLERQVGKVIDVLDNALPPSEPNASDTYSVDVNPIDPFEGPRDAKVTIVEAYEFLCPYCFLVNPTVNRIVAAYPRDVRVVAKYVVIHGDAAKPPAQAACAAHLQGKYLAMRSAIWAKAFVIVDDRPVRQPDITFEVAKGIASSLKLDMKKFTADFDGEPCKQWAQGAPPDLKRLGVNGTPAFFVNGRFLNGAVPFETIDALVKEELTKATKAIAGGMRQDAYYQSIVRSGKTAVPGRFDD